MAQRLFANGVNASRDGFAIVKREKRTAFVESNQTKTCRAIGDLASAGTQATLYFAFILAFVEHSFMQGHINCTEE